MKTFGLGLRFLALALVLVQRVYPLNVVDKVVETREIDVQRFERLISGIKFGDHLESVVNKLEAGLFLHERADLKFRTSSRQAQALVNLYGLDQIDPNVRIRIVITKEAGAEGVVWVVQTIQLVKRREIKGSVNGTFHKWDSIGKGWYGGRLQ